MSTKQQIEKNIKLSSKVASYIMDNPQVVSNVPEDSSYVVFSVDDQELNNRNEDLLVSLKNEGKNVVKVQETKNKAMPWNFISL